MGRGILWVNSTSILIGHIFLKGQKFHQFELSGTSCTWKPDTTESIVTELSMNRRGVLWVNCASALTEANIFQVLIKQYFLHMETRYTLQSMMTENIYLSYW